MPTYKHCTGCGRGYNQQAWQTESFCGSCGEPLKTGLQRDEPQEIHPYPDRDPPPKLRFAINDLLDQLSVYVSSATALTRLRVLSFAGCFPARRHPMGRLGLFHR
jgi:hypothetical protein